MLIVLRLYCVLQLGMLTFALNYKNIIYKLKRMIQVVHICNMICKHTLQGLFLLHNVHIALTNKLMIK